MSIGEDLKAVFEEVGINFLIVGESGTTDGGYLEYELNRQVTKPFIREFFINAVFPYDTDVRSGNIVRFGEGVANRDYIVMNQTPDAFEGVTTSWESVLYKANVSGEILRQSGEAFDSHTATRKPVWETVRSNAYALLTEDLYGNALDADQEFILMGIEKNELFIPAGHKIKEQDRYVASSGEYYLVETVDKRRFDGVDVCKVRLDQRT